MINFTIKTKWKDIDLSWAINKSLQQAVLLVQWKAVKNAPYQTWNLRRSITTDIKWDKWLVWTNVKYAKIREYVNKKNPTTRYYMRRALNSSINQIKQFFNKNISNLW